MDTQQVYAARLEAQMRAADARLDHLEAQARARNARAEMDEISGLRARRDEIRQKVTSAKKELGDDWEALRSRVGANWSDFRREIARSYTRYTAWDDARNRRFIAHLDEAESALREAAAQDAEVGADVRVGLGEARQELREKVAAARQKYDRWRAGKKDKKLQENLDDAELELEEASNRYAAAREATGQRAPGAKS